MSPFDVVRDFEQAFADYVGSRYAVATTSCTMALLLACAWFKHKRGPQVVSIPRHTYVGVGMSIVNAGHAVVFRDESWLGKYRLEPMPIVDAARWLTSGIHVPGDFTCFSCHWAKHLAISQGGLVATDDPEADNWMRRARFDGRREGVAPKDDIFDMIGWHAYMSPSTAAEGLTRLALLPKHNDPLPCDDYADLSQAPIFR